MKLNINKVARVISCHQTQIRHCTHLSGIFSRLHLRACRNLCNLRTLTNNNKNETELKSCVGTTRVSPVGRRLTESADRPWELRWERLRLRYPTTPSSRSPVARSYTPPFPGAVWRPELNFRQFSIDYIVSFCRFMFATYVLVLWIRHQQPLFHAIQ